MQATAVDFARIRALAPLASILNDDCWGSRSGNRYRCALCSANRIGTVDLEHYPASSSMHCFHCGFNGDVFDWWRELRRMTPEEVADRVDPTYRDAPLKPRRATPAPPPAPPRRQYHLDPTWQAAVDGVVRTGERCLWSPAGAGALDYLRVRGLDDLTIRRFRLGFSPAFRELGPFAVLDDRHPDPADQLIRVGRGIIIPLLARGSTFIDEAGQPRPVWQGAVVRWQGDDPADPLPDLPNGRKRPRYLGLKGTTRHELYPFPDFEASQLPAPALIVEGEVDALTLHQECGHLGLVATVGGANCRPSDHAIAQVARCPFVLVASDKDERGRQVYLDWVERLPMLAGRVRRPIRPGAKDVNAYHAAGGDLRGWLTGELTRLGWPARPPALGPPRTSSSHFGQEDVGDPETGMGDAYEGDLPDDLPRLIEPRRSA